MRGEREKHSSGFSFPRWFFGRSVVIVTSECPKSEAGLGIFPVSNWAIKSNAARSLCLYHARVAKRRPQRNATGRGKSSFYLKIPCIWATRDKWMHRKVLHDWLIWTGENFLKDTGNLIKGQCNSQTSWAEAPPPFSFSRATVLPACVFSLSKTTLTFVPFFAENLILTSSRCWLLCVCSLLPLSQCADVLTITSMNQLSQKKASDCFPSIRGALHDKDQ